MKLRIVLSVLLVLSISACAAGPLKMTKQGCTVFLEWNPVDSKVAPVYYKIQWLSIDGQGEELTKETTIQMSVPCGGILARVGSSDTPDITESFAFCEPRCRGDCSNIERVWY